MEQLVNITNSINSENTQPKLCELIKNDKTDVRIDNADNIIVYIRGKDTTKKTVISVVCENASSIVTSVNDKTAEFDEFPQTDKAALNDKEVFIGENSVGIIRCEYKENKIFKQKMELWESNTVKIGDFIKINNEFYSKGDNLYGFGVNQAATINTMISVINTINTPVNDIYFTVSFTQNSAKALAKTIKADYIFYIYSAKATDDFKISNGCGIVYKDGNAVTEFVLRDFMTDLAESKNIAFQKYIGKSAKLLEDFGIIGTSALVGGICLPTMHIKSGSPVVSKSDVTNAGNLLFEILNYKNNQGD